MSLRKSMFWPERCPREPPEACCQVSPRPTCMPRHDAQTANLFVVWGKTSSGFGGKEARLRLADSGTHFIGCIASFSCGNPWSPGHCGSRHPQVEPVGTKQWGFLSHSS